MEIRKVKVYSEETSKPTIYSILATSDIDARIIAFALDDGFSHSIVKMNEGHVELVKEWTEIV
jgi:hypothetical protein